MLCKALLLKSKIKLSTERNKILFYYLCHCSVAVYERAMTVFANEVDYVKRNTELRDLLNIDHTRDVASDMESAFVKAQY